MIVRMLKLQTQIHQTRYFLYASLWYTLKSHQKWPLVANLVLRLQKKIMIVRMLRPKCLLIANFSSWFGLWLVLKYSNIYCRCSSVNLTLKKRNNYWINLFQSLKKFLLMQSNLQKWLSNYDPEHYPPKEKIHCITQYYA